MELYASTAVWEDDGKLTVYDKTQGVQNMQQYLCSVFGMKPDEVRVLIPYMGGGFGSGLRPQYQALLAVLGAKALQRSVRLVLTRHQMYALAYRPATHRAACARRRAGRHARRDHARSHRGHLALRGFFAQRRRTGRACSTRATTRSYEHRLARLDLPTPSDMRAPGAATGVHALECAMDELAFAIKIDPLELRLR